MKTMRLQNGPHCGSVARVILGFLLLFCAVALTPGATYAYPVPVQVFYVSLPEADALTALEAINGAADPPMYTYFSIAVGFDNTYVYYDQWEDGYALDIANPTTDELYDSATNPAGLQIWGNGESDDGCAPNIAGVPVTCTDANDVLNAGDVIIPYNVVPEPRGGSYVLDTFSTVAYNNNNGNTNWSTDWVETGDFLTANYRDQFGTAAYNNSDGTLDWSGSSWREVGDDLLPTSGYVRIETANGLRFGRGSVLTPVGTAIYRAADVSGYTSATLSYSFSEYAGAAGDAVQVQVRNPGGAWVTLATIDGTMGSGTGAHDITAYMDSDTEVQFYVSAALESGEYIYFDNVDISLLPSPAGSSPSAGDILITAGQLRFSATEADDSIDRGVDLSTGGDCATLSFTLGQNAVDATGDNFAVQVSSDGGANYTTLETLDNPSDAGNKRYSIYSYASANTRVRFISIDALESGEYWTVDNVRVEWDCSIVFDARDKVGASKFIAMARAVWATGSGTLNAFAHEMYARAEWGFAYESPVGTNTANAGEMFEYSALTIMASQNDTQVQIDADANGTYETTVTLQEGGSTLVTGIRQGARVEANKPVQVALLTGDVGSNYSSRDMSLLPVSTWGSSYWTPVGVNTDNNPYYDTGPTRLFLYNPSSNGSIYVTCERYGVANTTLGPVGARGVVTTDLADYQGARCYASDSGGTATNYPIFGIGTVDTPDPDWDWSITLFPDNFLTTEALVGLGLGRDPTSGISPSQNGSPLWVTAACPSGSTSTYIYVDWNGDNIADLIDINGDGDTLDYNVGGMSNLDEPGSNDGLLVNRLQSVTLYEPPLDTEPYDQSGARVWSRTASGAGYGGTPGCKLSVAWGEDPRTASPASPGLDVGTSVPPLQEGPTAVQLLFFEATPGEELIELSWETASEIDNLGFNLYRATSVDGERTKINGELIPTQVPPGSPFGAVYEYEDTMAVRNQMYYYWLEVVDIYGQTEMHGPVAAQVGYESDLRGKPTIWVPLVLSGAWE